MPSPTAMYRFWKWLNTKYPNDLNINTEIWNYVNKYISPFHLDGRAKKKHYKRYRQKFIEMRAEADAADDIKPPDTPKPEITYYEPDQEEKIVAVIVNKENRKKRS